MLNKIYFCLRFGQLTAAAALRRFAAQLGVQAPAGMLVEGCLQGAARRAAGGVQAAAAVQQQTAFAEYLEALAFLAQKTVDSVQGVKQMTTTDTLLAAIACSWNAAMLLEGKGLPQRVGLGAPQHLRLCAAAVAPAILKGTPQITCNTVQQLLAVAMAVLSHHIWVPTLDAFRQRLAWVALRAHVLHTGLEGAVFMDNVYAVMCAVALHVQNMLGVQGLKVDGMSVLQSLELLVLLYYFWDTGRHALADLLVILLNGQMASLAHFDIMVGWVCAGWVVSGA